ncbi:hypothetical protein HMPREF1411_00933 [Helicobacter pylori GAM250AFi]|nr:hypothetical protein HMPREF1411_00933 [Helicobacter pylori GAM250AFi]EMH12319.1 hypothetical protein HMPREF1412_01395 [Helicobacter pylori GAM250T]EMH12552.1 hypothetical protein HMPREF1413_01493 [Helicobacter pylori GAM252Bi]EMH47077.1 hypothetical protein HMPREF1439_01126 [Helicobacter pylori HP250AFiii]EMH51071.1 hypothetical protein HMPREF1442_01568 [Helicobacter pylori HP250ASii]EMH52025.1 hypothetical protein HMPREF1441_01191 [Helicobacter pylori HP250ASi]EMH55438.1 hypothetical prot
MGWLLKGLIALCHKSFWGGYSKAFLSYLRNHRLIKTSSFILHYIKKML